MAEYTWNLSTLCRCCHSVGEFKSLQFSYTYKKNNEVYATMLQDTLGITISFPTVDSSFSICDECIVQLRAATRFKNQVAECELKFEEYLLQNEKKNKSLEITVDPQGLVKVEHDISPDNDDVNYGDEVRDGSDDSSDFDVEPVSESKNEDSIKTQEVKVKKESKKKSKSKKRKRGSKTDTPLKREIRKKREITREFVECFCNDCGAKFNSKSGKLAHTRADHKNTKHVCNYCQAEIIGSSTYYRHLHYMHGDSTEYQSLFGTKQFICDICQAVFKRKSSIIIHMTKHLGKYTKQVCEICGVSYYDVFMLRRHVKYAHESDGLFCNVCNKTFKSYNYYKKHMLRHDGIRRIPCQYCDKKFVCFHDRNTHQQKVHEDARAKKKYVYTKPKKVYPSVNPKITCKLCGTTRTGKLSYERHLHLKHDGPRPKSYYKEKKRKMQCVECGLVLRSLNGFKAHCKMHMNIKTRCKICKVDIVDIKKHMLTHTIRPFSCEHCPNTYPTEKARDRHLKSHFASSREQFCCGSCSYLSTSKRGLQMHLRKKHGINLKLKMLNVSDRGNVAESGSENVSVTGSV